MEKIDLIDTIIDENTILFEDLLAKNININAREKGRWTPLMASSMHNKVYMAKRLIEVGADINAKTSNGYTALIIACEYCNLDIAKILLENEADVSLKRLWGLVL